MNTNLWLVGMSGPKSLDNLKALIEPVRAFFDGVVWTLHDSRDSGEATYLESVKGRGKVIHYYYSARHDQSRNQYLWCGPIKQGDWCVQIDENELLSPTFAGRLREQIDALRKANVNLAYYYGKPFLFEYHESLVYQGTPHEGLNRQDGAARATELNVPYSNENDVRMNMRPFRRGDPFNWVDHYCKYYLIGPWGSNHCLLGNEHRGDAMAIYRKRETLRVQFRDLLLAKGHSLDLMGLYSHLRSFEGSKNTIPEVRAKPFDPITLRVLNEEKIVQDYYRYHILNDKTVVDDHTWPGMKTYI